MPGVRERGSVSRMKEMQRVPGEERRKGKLSKVCEEEKEND